MNNIDQNPFEGRDPDRAEIWDMLVRRDIEAFVARDWPAHAGCFVQDGFFGVHAHGATNSDHWRLGFATLDDYKPNWIDAAKKAATKTNVENLRRAHFGATTLDVIDIRGDKAICHKKFDGAVHYDDGSNERLLWKTIYQCCKIDGRWWIGSFVGFLPNDSA